MPLDHQRPDVTSETSTPKSRSQIKWPRNSEPSYDGVDNSIVWVPLLSGRYIDGVLYQRVKQQLLRAVPL